MKSFIVRSQLILSHLLPLIIVLPVLGLIFITIVESQILLVNVVDDLRRAAVTVAAQAATEPIVWQDNAQAQAFVEKFRANLQREVILLQPDGSAHQARTPSRLTDLAVLQSGQSLIKSQYSLSLVDAQAEAYAPVLDAQRVIVGIVQVTDRLGDVYQGFLRIRNLVILSLLGAFVVAHGHCVVAGAAYRAPLAGRDARRGASGRGPDARADTGIYSA